MNKLASNGMVVCISWPGQQIHKGFSKWFHHFEFDSAPVRMLCAVLSTSNGYLCRPNAGSFPDPKICSWSPCAMQQNFNIPEALNHSSARCKSVSKLSKWKS
jgi:hypothetical protein